MSASFGVDMTYLVIRASYGLKMQIRRFTLFLCLEVP